MTRTPGRRWAYLGALLGGAVSIAANVAHSYVPPAEVAKAIAAAARAGTRAPDWAPHAGAVVGAVFWPLALFVAVEIFARIVWPAGSRWTALRFLGLLPVALVAAVVSYRHLSGLLAFYGEDGLTVVIGPLAVDGLMVMATGALIATSRARVDAAEFEVPAATPVADSVPAVAADTVDPDVAALCDEILNQARRARHEVSRSLLWQPAPMALPPIAHAEPVRTAVIEATTVPEPVSTAAEKPTGTRTAEHKKTRTDAKKPRTGTPTKGRTAKKTGTRTDDELIAALAGVPREPDGTVPVRRAASTLGTGPDRARKLLAAAGLLRTEPVTEPDSAPVNGTPVPELVTADQGATP